MKLQEENILLYVKWLTFQTANDGNNIQPS